MIWWIGGIALILVLGALATDWDYVWQRGWREWHGWREWLEYRRRP